MDFAIVGVAFWAWLAAVGIAEEVGTTKRRHADLELIRFTIEKGQPLSPELVRELFAKPTTSLLVSGIITMAAGIGLVLFALFLGRNNPRSGWVVAGAAMIAICVGIGLMISHRLVRPTQA